MARTRPSAQSVREGHARWRPIHDKLDDEGELIDRYRIHEPEATTAEGYRLVWYHSARKAELDALARHKRIERATTALTELRAKLTSPRTRYRDQAKVALAVEAILRDGEAEGLLIVEIEAKTTETYRQERRGRRGPETRYVRSEATRFDLSWRIDHDRLAVEARCDGVFPLVSNVTTMSALDLLLAYKQQPMIEKRFSQLKTDFVVAPVFLKEVSRIQALLCVYFFALLVESLLERELRRAMEREGVESLPLYPEGRAVPPPDGATGDRPVRGRSAPRVDGARAQTAVGLHHRADPPATQDPPPAGDAQGLQRLIPQAVGNSRIFSGRCAESRIGRFDGQLPPRPFRLVGTRLTKCKTTSTCRCRFRLPKGISAEFTATVMPACGSSGKVPR